jgi:predicted Zn-dependent protease
LLTQWSKNLPISDVLVGKLVLHEIGHTLGIVGHSDNRDDIMFYSIDVSPREGRVSERDVKTLSELYK